MLSWRDRYLEKLKDKIQNYQSRRSGEKAHHIYETYNNILIPRGRHICSKSSHMEKATMCTYPQSDHALPHWKCVLWCCAECPCISLPDQEIYNQYSKTTPSIRFQIYHIVVHCTAHGRITLKDKKIC